MSSEVKQNKKKELKIIKPISIKPMEYKDLNVETKIYIKTSALLHKLDINYTENDEVIKSFQGKLNGLFGIQATHQQLEALEFVLSNKPKDIIEAYHLLNMFTVSDYMRMINGHLHNNKVQTHEQQQEYIKIGGKTMEQYAKGMLSLKAYREGFPQIQNNTLNQVNIHAQNEAKPKETECAKHKNEWHKNEGSHLQIEQKESLSAEKIAIKMKENV